ncbi:MAG: FAD-binding protein [Nocardioides sp.]
MSDLITIQGDELPRVKAAVPVRIELFALDTDHCSPCRAALSNLQEAAAELTRTLDSSTYDVDARLVRLSSPEQARELGVVSSPTVRVNGLDIELDVEEEPCTTCSDLAGADIACRTYEWQGRRHDHPPVALLVERVREHLDHPEREPGPRPGVLETQSSSSIDRFFEARTGPRDSLPLTKLRDVIDGLVATPEDPGYADIVAPWNLAVAVQPLVAVDAASAHDVVETVRFARRHGLTVTPQATGHGAIERLVGEVLISTRRLDECVVHPEGWARVGAGVKWLRVVLAAAPHGLAPLSGSITDVGVVGYTTGGGLGPMARTYGLASDRVRAIEVVTGDGELRRATPTRHPELFFGLRGGKGALGVVTAVEFDLVHQPDFYGGALWFDGSDTAAVLERWRTWSATLPEAATTSFALFQLPAQDGIPEPLAGRLTVSVRYVWTGTPADGERALAGMRAAAPILIDDVAVKPYTEIDSVHNDPLDPMPVREHSILLDDFPAPAVEALMSAVGPRSGSRQILVEVRQLGGAYTRGGDHPSAFDPRHAAYAVLAVGLPGEETEVDHDVLQRALAPWALPERLPNFSFTPEQLEAAYRGATRDRILAALATYDPQGVMAISRAIRETSPQHGYAEATR